MANLSTKYMGLELKNPLLLRINSNSPYSNIDSLKRAEDAGFSAVVLKSIYEEQINASMEGDMKEASDYLSMSDAYGFLSNASKEYYVGQYLDFVAKAKEALSIPVIARINCSNSKSWLDFANMFASCKADAIEIDHFNINGNTEVTGAAIEKEYLAMAKEVRNAIKKPLAMKLSWNFTSIANITKSLSRLGMDGIVLFNHISRSDIDIENVKVMDKGIQPTGDFSETLRWTAMVSHEVKANICSATGIRESSTIIKLLLAGAKAVQIGSIAEEKGLNCAGDFIKDIIEWMDRHNYSSMVDFNGLLAQERITNPEVWERHALVNRLTK
ncbi:MAG: dihydroorotate oxidase [Sphaerochaetaceae bacterium]|nr:dihydroorotate oxidase [Sphaerochaetaceae bacterium]